jgi:hypothetical protein
MGARARPNDKIARLKQTINPKKIMPGKHAGSPPNNFGPPSVAAPTTAYFELQNKYKEQKAKTNFSLDTACGGGPSYSLGC